VCDYANNALDVVANAIGARVGVGLVLWFEKRVPKIRRAMSTVRGLSLLGGLSCRKLARWRSSLDPLNIVSEITYSHVE
jgi:hypothetical protein